MNRYQVFIKSPFGGRNRNIACSEPLEQLDVITLSGEQYVLFINMGNHQLSPTQTDRVLQTKKSGSTWEIEVTIQSRFGERSERVYVSSALRQTEVVKLHDTEYVVFKNMGHTKLIPAKRKHCQYC